MLPSLGKTVGETLPFSRRLPMHIGRGPNERVRCVPWIG